MEEKFGEETVAPLSPPVPVFEKDFGEVLKDPPVNFNYEIPDDYPEKASFRPLSRPRSTEDYEKLTDAKVMTGADRHRPGRGQGS